MTTKVDDPKTIKLKHPDSNQTIEVNEDHADVYFSQNWERADKLAPKADDK